MTVEELQEILGKADVGEVVKALQITSYPNLPKWADLVKEYDPLQHQIWNTTKYPTKLDDNNNDDFKRTALALQKLAVNRVSQAMFSTPVQRIYNYDKGSSSAQKAVDILEELYHTQNCIDSENIERCKQNNASCQAATVWRVVEKLMIVEEVESKFKLTHASYSEMDGYTIYPINDSNGDLLVLSIGYKDLENKEHLMTYINTETPKVIMFSNLENWEVIPELSKDLMVFPVVYTNIPEPVWGGLAGTNLVEQLEEMESFQGLYIKRNALPTFTIDYGKVVPGSTLLPTEESSSDSRRIIKLAEGGKMADVTWDGAEKATSSRYSRIRNAFFEAIQVPDTSFANMISSNTSAENKELIFADAKAKARDLGGEWEKLFYEELTIIIEFAKVMFPKQAKEYETISVRSKVKPYSLRTKKDNAEFVAVGSLAMSKATQVSELGVVDDVNAEVEAIENEASVNTNQLI